MSETSSTALADRLVARFGDTLRKVGTVRGETTIEVAPQDLYAVAAALRDEAQFRFAELIDTCGVDYLAYAVDEWETAEVKSRGYSRGVEGQAVGRFSWAERPRPNPNVERRFASVTHLLSIEHNERLRVRSYCEDDEFPVVPSLTGLWSSAMWFERESFDLYGIIYEGHPDLRRILTDYGFVGHPFRKDFPLIGNVEVRYDAEKGRVIYEPVTSVVPRVLVPKVIRNDADLEQARAEAADHWREN